MGGGINGKFSERKMYLSVKMVKIKSGKIKLDQFLKWADLAASGGEAKLFIQNGHVKLNGKVETRRSKYIKVGDKVEFADKGIFQVAE